MVATTMAMVGPCPAFSLQAPTSALKGRRVKTMADAQGVVERTDQRVDTGSAPERVAHRTRTKRMMTHRMPVGPRS